MRKTLEMLIRSRIYESADPYTEPFIAQDISLIIWGLKLSCYILTHRALAYARFKLKMLSM